MTNIKTIIISNFEYAFMIMVLGIIDCIAWGITGHYSTPTINGVLLGIISITSVIGYGIGRLASICHD